jgi:hypothetical protein
MHAPDPPPVTKQACKGRNKQGAPCRAGVAKGQDWCFAHDPARAQQAAAARQKGGKHRSKPKPAPPIDLSTPELQRKAIEQAIDRVRNGAEPLSMGRFVVYAVSLARPVLELEDVVVRIAALEERMGP